MKIKIVVAGSRSFSDYERLKVVLLTELESGPFTIISGGAEGADKLGERFAREHCLEIIKMPAEWDKYGKSAGPIRNTEMAKLADKVIVFWDGVSKGTKHMIKEGRRLNKPVTIYLEESLFEEM